MKPKRFISAHIQLGAAEPHLETASPANAGDGDGVRPRVHRFVTDVVDGDAVVGAVPHSEARSSS